MTTVSLRLEDNLKKELDLMCDEMGMSLTTFFTIYAKRALRDRKIPFEITAPEPDLDPTKLNWDRIREELLASEERDRGKEGIPWEEVRADMRRRVHGNL